MTTKLGLYNLALGTYIGTRTLHPTSGLTEDVAERYALDRVYTSCLAYMLQQASWDFALRTVELEPEAGTPAFHRQHQYEKPEDFVRICRIGPDARFDVPFEDYRPEGNYIYADINPLYLQYVSNDADYGGDLTRFPASYEQAVASWLAYQSLLPVNKDRGDRNDLLNLHNITLAQARRSDAVDEPVKTKPMGRWSQSRQMGSSLNGTRRGLR